MANRKGPRFHSNKLTAAENRAVNGMIRRSWKNGNRTGFRAAVAKIRGRK